MEIGVGLPTAIPGVTGPIILEWAQAADRANFSTVAAVDRVAYPNLESLTVLAAAAAVTQRIRLTTSILIGPLRHNTAVLAKQAASVDQLSSGRLVLGMAVGSRPDDYAASNMSMAGRGDRLEDQVTTLRQLWPASTSAGSVGPPPIRDGGPPVLLGGHAQPALYRAARLADGWIGGITGPGMFRTAANTVAESWKENGRSGQPRFLALAYFALGTKAEQTANEYIHHYYASTGRFAEFVYQGAATSRDVVADLTEQYSRAGCDELIFMPCSPDAEQLHLLAGAIPNRPGGG